MSEIKCVRTAAVFVQLADDDPNAVHSRVLGVNDREVFNALRRYTALRQLEFDKALRAHLRKARKERRRLRLDDEIPGLLPWADCGND